MNIQNIEIILNLLKTNEQVKMTKIIYKKFDGIKPKICKGDMKDGNDCDKQIKAQYSQIIKATKNTANLSTSHCYKEMAFL